MKPDEKLFFTECCKKISNHGNLLYTGIFPRDISREIGIPHKRAKYLLSKWTDKGWYNYGVSLDLGWITQKGNVLFEERI